MRTVDKTLARFAGSALAAVALGGAALDATACVQRPEAAIEPIKVGVVNPISGALASLGPQWEDAARLAQEDVNAGGGVFDGRPLELVFKDSGTDPDTAVAAANELVDEGVVGLVGPATSGESTRVLADVVEQAQIPMISCCATATELTEGNSPNSGFFFRTTPSDKLQGKALAFIAKSGFHDGGINVEACPVAAFMNRNDAYGAGFKAVFEGEYVGQLVVGSTGRASIVEEGDYGTPDQEANQGDLDAAAVSLADDIGNDAAFAVNSPPELCIVVISFDVDGAEVIKKMDERLTGINDDRVATGDPAISYHYLVGDGANSSAFASVIGPVNDLRTRIVGTVPFHATNGAYDEFVKAFKARYEQSTEPIAFTAQNYDAVFVMALAVTQAKSTVGKDIRNSLFTVSGAHQGQRFEGAFFGEVANAVLAGKDVDYVGPSGELTFDAFGDVVGDYVLWQVGDPDAQGAYDIAERTPLLAATFNPQ